MVVECCKPLPVSDKHKISMGGIDMGVIMDFIIPGSFISKNGEPDLGMGWPFCTDCGIIKMTS